MFPFLTTCAVLLAAMFAGAAHQQQTAEISGMVTTTTSPPLPLARVLVTISGDAVKRSRTTITDNEGRFVFGNLPSGSFTIVATRPPYVRTEFGALRPGRQGTSISLAAGQRLSGVTIGLARGAAITGMIRTVEGEPAPGIRVEALPLGAQAASVAAAETDDRGIYRIFGLTPGSYVARASVSDDGRRTMFTHYSDTEMDEILARLQRRSSGLSATQPAAGAPTAPERAGMDRASRPATYGYAPIHYPGTPDPDQAATVELADGEERGGVDISLQFVRTVAIQGRVSIASSGEVPPSTQVTLTRAGVRARATNSLMPAPTTQSTDPSGVFRFVGLLPGRYRISARAVATTPTGSATSSGAPTYSVTGVLWAVADIVVGEDDVTGVALALEPGLRVAGRIVFDAKGRTAPSDLSAIRLRVVDVNGGTAFLPPAAVRRDGTFELTGVAPGTYTLASSGSEPGWWLRSAIVNGRDMLDFPLDLGPDGDMTGALVTFTDKDTGLSGTLQGAANIPAPQYFIVVFPSDRAFWRPAARRVRFTRPNTGGRYSFSALPAGEYLIAALTDLESTDLSDVTFLEHLAPAAVPVQIAEGEKKTQDLRIARLPTALTPARESRRDDRRDRARRPRRHR